MIQRPVTCIGCPLNESSVPGFCPDKIPATATYLFLAEAPGATEIKQAVPMVGKAGFVLQNWLVRAVSHLQLAWDKGEIGLANVLRCLPKEVQGRPYPKGKDKEEAERFCRQYDHIPNTVHTVVLFGEHSQHLHFKAELEAEDASDRRLGREVKGVTGRIGREYQKDGKRWIFSAHPAFMLRQPSMVEHGQRALQIASNVEVVVEPSYIPWNDAIQELR